MQTRLRFFFCFLLYFYFFNFTIDKRKLNAYNLVGDNMEVKNPLYKNIGIHVISTIFTVENGIVKVLLIKRKNNPYNGFWALVGGALYNNESLIDGMYREMYEKTGISDIDIYLSSIIDDINRSPIQRMIAATYIGIIDSKKVSLLKSTSKTEDASWTDINSIPKLAYDHNKILNDAINTLKQRITESNILHSLYPEGFTIPEIQKVYETILNKKFDRRNFRKKLLSWDFIVDTNMYRNFEGSKPAKIYKFSDSFKENKNIF